jgi:hypothetical protein
MDLVDIRDFIVRKLIDNSFTSEDQAGNILTVVEKSDFAIIADEIIEEIGRYKN